MALLKRIILSLCIIAFIIIPAQSYPDIATNATTWSGAFTSAASNAVDRDAATFWLPDPFAYGYMGIDLLKTSNIEKIGLLTTTSYTTNLFISGSNDNITFYTIRANSSYNFQENVVGYITVNTSYRYINISLHGGANSSYISEVYINVTEPQLISPINGSSQSKSYPPLTSDIYFSWSESNLSEISSRLVIAKDVNFNIIASDTTTSNSYSTQPLEADDYWWKVAYYNTTTGTYYNYSNVSNFTLTNIITATGTGIDGIVYELIGTTQTPLSGATVYLYNSTLSQTTTIGSNGYYLFNGLENSTTYNIYVWKKDFDSSPTMPITTGNGTITTKNIEIKRTQPLFFDADKQYVLLKARWLYCLSSCDIAGATISVYNSGEVIPYASGITDSTGSISFLLYKTQLYRITIVKASEGVNKEETLYPKDNSYIFLITNSPISWRNHTIEQKDAITIAVTKNIINSTHTYINVSYNDSLAETTALGISISNNNTSAGSWSGSGNTSQSFIISNYSGKSYLVSINGTHTTYGALSETYSVFFEKSAVGITGIPEALWLWFMIAIMFFTAAVFTASTAELGLIIVSAEGWIGLALGAFSTINTTQFGIGLSLVTILGVLAYIKKQQAKEGMV